jgi:integrase
MGAPGLGQQTIFRLREQIAQGTEIRANSPRVRQALVARYSEQKEGWIFPSKRARGGHLTTVAKQFEKARKEAGLPNDLVLYCARHGFGTEMYRATKNLFAVMNVMGHTTVSTTMKYQHQNIDEVAEVASHRVQ